MKEQGNELKVGIVVTASILLFIGIIIFIGQGKGLFAERKVIKVRFDHRSGIQGLRPKDPVRIGGLNVGNVKKMWLQEDTIKKDGREEKKLFVYVLAEIPEEIQLRSDCKITIGTKFVGEGGTLDILDVGSRGKIVTPEDTITGLAPEGFAQLTAKLSRELDETNPESLLYLIKSQLDVKNSQSIIAKIHKTLNDINIISAKIREELEPTQKETLLAKIHLILNNLSDATEAIKRELSSQVDTSTLYKIHTALDKLNESIAEVSSILNKSRPKLELAVQNIEKATASIADELNKDKEDSSITKLHTILDQARASLENIKSITQTGKELIIINRDSIQMTIDNLAETSAHLKATAKELRRNPWKLLYKPDRPELEYANLLETARTFSDAADSLEIVSSKLNQMLKMYPEGIPSTEPEFLKIREELIKTYCTFEQAQKRLWKLLKDRLGP